MLNNLNKLNAKQWESFSVKCCSSTGAVDHLDSGIPILLYILYNIYYKLYSCIGKYWYAKTQITENNMVVNNVNYNISNRYVELPRYRNKWLCRVTCYIIIILKYNFFFFDNIILCYAFISFQKIYISDLPLLVENCQKSHVLLDQKTGCI